MENKNMDWQNLFRGIREVFDLSQKDLSEKVDISRRQIGKYERSYRTPNKKAQEEILGLVGKTSYSSKALCEKGKDYESPEGLRTVNKEKDLELNEDIAELIGIILGDGECKADGTVRVSFNPHNEREYVEDRTIKLLQQVSDNKITFESEKRVQVNDRSLVLFLKSKGLEPGSKFEKNWGLTEELKADRLLRRGVLRGLFDTDGSFGFDGQRTSIQYGRFSERSQDIIELTKEYLEKEKIKYSASQNKDGRWKIRVNDTVHIRKFFRKIGSSNYKHIARYLAWRDDRKQVKVTNKDLEKILTEAEIEEEIETPFKSKDPKDRKVIEGEEFRSQNDISKIVEQIYDSEGYDIMVNQLNVNKRTIRKWRNSKRNPSPIKSFKIKQIAEA